MDTIECSKIKHYKHIKKTVIMIPPTTRKFIDSLIDYYTSEAASYKQLANTYKNEIEDIESGTFGIIVGCVYSGFLQSYQNQKQKPSLEDIQEFTQMIKTRALQIKKSIASSDKK